jgi:hypothetical protein
MAPPVVTLFEKYGAGARYIGPRVADALGVAWFDQAFSSADIDRELQARHGIHDQGDVVVDAVDAIEPIREQ